MANTVVSAGFSRRMGRHWVGKNVQNIVVPLPESKLGSGEFRVHVAAAHPLGGGWILQGYCIAKTSCVCGKNEQWLSPGHTQDGKPCHYCAECIPL